MITVMPSGDEFTKTVPGSAEMNILTILNVTTSAIGDHG